MAIEDMTRYHETRFTTWDLANIYGPAEDFIGKFRLKLSTLKGKEELDKVAYGCRGLMSETYYFKTKEPSISELNALSLRKYKKMIDKWDGWSLFQQLLSTLNRMAQKYNVNIANVATRYILDKPAVAGVIIGVRLGIVDHRSSNMQVFNFSLTKSDYDDIDVVCTKSNNLFETIGDCGDEYR
ncbi:MAG: aldo/keto reductase [Candidatus Nitrosopolaris sp.]